MAVPQEPATQEGGVKPPLQEPTQEPTRKIGVWGTREKPKNKPKSTG
jgi:hypothetical protein